MAKNFNADERRRRAARHEYCCMTPASVKRERREEDGGCSVLFPSFGLLNYLLLFGVGGDLLSHNLPVAVPSACAGLASGFGMGPGVSLQLLTTDKHTKQKYPLGCPFAWVLCQILHSGRGHDSDCFFILLFCLYT